ncbi:MAG: DNA/RNA nuclease SfsA [Aigarchaeota archaeon]|nr:DNA/RNA nuclease SfsA [Candidatus Geocrenenecus dongiae]
MRKIVTQLQLKCGEIVRRDSRVSVLARDEARTFRLHLSNTGKLVDLIYPGAKILYLEKIMEKTSGRVIGVIVNDLAVLIDTITQARVFEIALEKEMIDWLKGYNVKKKEARMHGVRFDYLLSNGLEDIVVELKSAAYLSNDGAAMYPDTPSERGLKHVRILNELKKNNISTMIIFIAAHPYSRYFKPNFQVHPELRDALCESIQLGVPIKSLKIYLEIDGRIILEDPDLPVKIDC